MKDYTNEEVKQQLRLFHQRLDEVADLATKSKAKTNSIVMTLLNDLESFRHPLSYSTISDKTEALKEVDNLILICNRILKNPEYKFGKH